MCIRDRLNLRETLQGLTVRNLQECYNDAIYYRDEMRQLFITGRVTLRQRTLADKYFWAIINRIAEEKDKLKHMPKELALSLIHIYLDLGGGLAVDYDGSHTNYVSSRNYSIDEYCTCLLYTSRAGSGPVRHRPVRRGHPQGRRRHHEARQRRLQAAHGRSLLEGTAGQVSRRQVRPTP